MLRRWLNRLNGHASFSAVDPEAPFSAIGDIHGRAELLKRFLDSAKDRQIICVGDYIDRGDHSADVLRILHARSDIICLSGNHEEMMLRFMEAPEKYGERWLRFGGLQTLTSFGVSGIDRHSNDSALKTARNALEGAVGKELLQWMRAMPTWWQSGNVAVVHAGADPAMPIEKQTSQILRWGHPKFETQQRKDGVWVMHGHTIVETAQAQAGRIAIDTGAYVTGRLTVAHVERGSLTFETIT